MFMQKVPYCIPSEGILGAPWCARSSSVRAYVILTWTYHPFDELKVTIVDNGHGTPGHTYVVEVLVLFVLAKYK